MSALGHPPDGLPVPIDDGAADHLPGTALPDLALPSTGGGEVALRGLGSPRAVLYLYPMTGQPGVDLPPGWEQIPGARGCTPESCGFRDHHAELAAQGAEVVGISTQTTADQQEAATRLALPFPLLSDPDLRLGTALDLPTFDVEGVRRYTRLTLVVRDGAIEHVVYPVFPPGGHAERMVAWLRSTSS